MTLPGDPIVTLEVPMKDPVPFDVNAATCTSYRVLDCRGVTTAPSAVAGSSFR